MQDRRRPENLCRLLYFPYGIYQQLGPGRSVLLQITGRMVYGQKPVILYEWAKSEHLWQQRIAMVTCMHFVRQGDFKDCLAIADLLLQHPHDLIQKAVGWLLRETGKKTKKRWWIFWHPVTLKCPGRCSGMPSNVSRKKREKIPYKKIALKIPKAVKLLIRHSNMTIYHKFFIL